MKRDMDIIVRIAMESESLAPGQTMSGLDGVEEEAFALHVIWMEEAGLIKAVIAEAMDETETPSCFVLRLTWDGCEFVDAIRDKTVWAKAKREIIAPGMSFTFDILREWLKTEITQGFPTIRRL